MLRKSISTTFSFYRWLVRRQFLHICSVFLFTVVLPAHVDWLCTYIFQISHQIFSLGVDLKTNITIKRWTGREEIAFWSTRSNTYVFRQVSYTICKEVFGCLHESLTRLFACENRALFGSRIYLSIQALSMQEAPTARLHRNLPILPSLAHLVRASVEQCTTCEIEICGHGESNRSSML